MPPACRGERLGKGPQTWEVPAECVDTGKRSPGKLRHYNDSAFLRRNTFNFHGNRVFWREFTTLLSPMLDMPVYTWKFQCWMEAHEGLLDLVFGFNGGLPWTFLPKLYVRIHDYFIKIYWLCFICQVAVCHLLYHIAWINFALCTHLKSFLLSFIIHL